MVCDLLGLVRGVVRVSGGVRREFWGGRGGVVVVYLVSSILRFFFKFIYLSLYNFIYLLLFL